MVRGTRASANAVAAAAELGEVKNEEDGHDLGQREGSANGSISGIATGGRSTRQGGKKAGNDVLPTPSSTTPSSPDDTKKRKRSDANLSPPLTLSPSRVTRTTQVSPSQPLRLDPVEGSTPQANGSGGNGLPNENGPAVKKIKLRAGGTAVNGTKANGVQKITLKLPGTVAGDAIAEEEEADDKQASTAKVPDNESESGDRGDNEIELGLKRGRTKVAIPKRVNGKFVRKAEDVSADRSSEVTGDGYDGDAPMEGIEIDGPAPGLSPPTMRAGESARSAAASPVPADSTKDVVVSSSRQPPSEAPNDETNEAVVVEEAVPEGIRYPARRSGRHPRTAQPPPVVPSRAKRRSVVAASSDAGGSVDMEDVTWPEESDDSLPLTDETKKDLIAVLDLVAVPSKSKSLLDQAAATGGSVTLRRRLEQYGTIISLNRIEHLLQRLAIEQYPSCMNPFRAAPTEPAVISSARSRKSKAKVAVEEDYLVSIKRILDTFARSSVDTSKQETAATPLPTIRWHLHQRLPAAVPNAKPPRGVDPTRWVPPPPVMQEWYTSLVTTADPPPPTRAKPEDEKSRSTRSQRVKAESEVEEHDAEASNAMEQLFQSSAFGKATPVFTAEVEFEEEVPPTLGEVLLMKASLKAKAWKEKRSGPSGPMGFTGRPVEFLHCKGTFTPSFAPTHNSARATGGLGYQTSAELAKYRTNGRTWREAGWGKQFGRGWQEQLAEETQEEEDATDLKPGESSRQDRVSSEDSAIKDIVEQVFEEGERQAVIEAVRDQQEYSGHLQELLDQNARWVQEMAYWREIRIRRGDGPEPGEEEASTAEKLMKSLQELTAIASPAQLLGTKRSSSATSFSAPGLAAYWAKLSIPGKTPDYKGTLDANRRTRALADNLTFADKPMMEVPNGPQQQASISHLPQLPGPLAVTPAQSSASPGLPHPNPAGHAYPTLPPVKSQPASTLVGRTVNASGLGTFPPPHHPLGGPRTPHASLPFPSGRIPNPMYGAVPPKPMYPPPNPYANVPYSPFVNVGRTTKDVNGTPRAPLPNPLLARYGQGGPTMGQGGAIPTLGTPGPRYAPSSAPGMGMGQRQYSK